MLARPRPAGSPGPGAAGRQHGAMTPAVPSPTTSGPTGWSSESSPSTGTAGPSPGCSGCRPRPEPGAPLCASATAPPATATRSRCRGWPSAWPASTASARWPSTARSTAAARSARAAGPPFWPEWQREGSVEDMTADWRLALDVARACRRSARARSATGACRWARSSAPPSSPPSPASPSRCSGLMGITGPDHYRPRVQRAAEAITVPVLFLMQLEDELFTRPDCLALFDALGVGRQAPPRQPRPPPRGAGRGAALLPGLPRQPPLGGGRAAGQRLRRQLLTQLVQELRS